MLRKPSKEYWRCRNNRTRAYIHWYAINSIYHTQNLLALILDLTDRTDFGGAMAFHASRTKFWCQNISRCLDTWGSFENLSFLTLRKYCMNQIQVCFFAHGSTGLVFWLIFLSVSATDPMNYIFQYSMKLYFYFSNRFTVEIWDTLDGTWLNRKKYFLYFQRAFVQFAFWNSGTAQFSAATSSTSEGVLLLKSATGLSARRYYLTVIVMRELCFLSNLFLERAEFWARQQHSHGTVPLCFLFDWDCAPLPASVAS